MGTLIRMMTTRNVGTWDRVARIVAGLALAALGWALSLPLAAAIGLSAVGVMVAATGVSGACSIYYMLGYSTCPISGAPAPRGGGR